MSEEMDEGQEPAGMMSAPEDGACMEIQPIDMISAVKELHMLSPQELGKLIRDADNDIIQWTPSDDGSLNQIEVETLARYITIHLIAMILESESNEELFKYLLGGIRLLHNLCDLAPRHSKLVQILLEDVKISEQMFDLIFFTITVLVNAEKNCSSSSHMVLLHSALLACSLHLLTAFISSQWNDLAVVLLAHPKVDLFASVSFAALHVDIKFLRDRLSAQLTDTDKQSNLAEVNRLCQHCEASLQFLQSLCQHRNFRERLVKNKDVCEEGGILLLAQEIMKLPFCEDSYLMAVVSRLKSKVLSILLHLCEVESVSFLDVAASTTEGLELAKSTIFQVLDLLRTMFGGDLNALAAFSDKTYPRGLLQLNAMRLTEILSDDSNFRSYITLNFTEVLTSIFLLPHAEFVANWCSSDTRPSEEDATLDYDSLAAAGWVLGVFPSSDVPESTFNACRVPRTSYALQRTSLLVKIVANLTCFIPDLCKEEKDLFLNTFLQCLKKELPNLPCGVSNDADEVDRAEAERAAIVSQNLRSLLCHAESLITGFLNEDDVQLLRMFIAQLEPLITQESNTDRVKEAEDLPLEEMNKLSVNKNEDPSNALPRQEQTFSARGIPESDGDAPNVEVHVVDTSIMQNEEKQMRKRKRNIMNHAQISMIEKALQNEPDMQRKAASIHLWAEKISLHGSEISSSQLKNWLNNRKAKLARAAAKDIRPPSGGDSTFTDKQGGSGTDSPESPDEFFEPSPSATQHQSSTRNSEPSGSVKLDQGQQVVLIDGQGEEVGKGSVHQATGMWFGTNLDESGMCVVDVTWMKADKWSNVPHPSEGLSEQVGMKRVLWESGKVVVQQKPR